MQSLLTTAESLIEIDDLVFDGLENIKLSGVTRMENRNLVIGFAREWEYDETAAWIETVDERIYNKLINDRPDLINNKLMLDINDLGMNRPDSENIANSNDARAAS